jgi:hypothetical protein
MKALAALALLVGGAAVGVAAVAVHELWWGLPLTVLAVAPSLVALPAGWWARLPAALGFALVVGWLAIPRAEGDYVIGSDLQGYLVVTLALVTTVAGIATLPRPNRVRSDPDPRRDVIRPGRYDSHSA